MNKLLFLPAFICVAACAGQGRPALLPDAPEVHDRYLCQREDWKEVDAKMANSIGPIRFTTNPVSLTFRQDRETALIDPCVTLERKHCENEVRVFYRSSEAIAFKPILPGKTMTIASSALSYTFLPRDKKLLVSSYNVDRISPRALHEKTEMPRENGYVLNCSAK